MTETISEWRFAQAGGVLQCGCARDDVVERSAKREPALLSLRSGRGGG